MEKIESPEELTEITLDAIEFDVELSDSVFTLSNLRNPRN
jgi:outer membrane lipoprotein-sorting protein